LPIVSLSILTGCWNTDVADLADGPLDYTPRVEAPHGWLVENLDDPLTCPDGQSAAITVVYPSDPEAALSVSLLLHSATFDYVLEPLIDNPIGAEHYRTPPALNRDWALRRVFTTIGMYVDQETSDDLNGALAVSLVEQGSVLVVPSNCWGDFWHNASDLAGNDASIDLFDRNGRSLAEWSWLAMTDPAFASQAGVDLPDSVFQTDHYMIGLSEGGRGVGELFAMGYQPKAFLIDSSPDDLNSYYDQPELYADVLLGLNRIFPGGASETDGASLANVPTFPDRLSFIYSSLDGSIPAGSQSAALARLEAFPEAWVYDTASQHHVQTGEDVDLSRSSVAWMMNTEPYDPDAEEPDTGS